MADPVEKETKCHGVIVISCNVVKREHSYYFALAGCIWYIRGSVERTWFWNALLYSLCNNLLENILSHSYKIIIKMTTITNINDLPNEMLYKIFNYCNIKDWWCLSYICQRFFDISFEIIWHKQCKSLNVKNRKKLSSQREKRYVR